MSENRTPEEYGDELPDRIIEELRTRAHANVSVPARLDAVVLADARSVLKEARPQRKRRFRQWTLGAVSVGGLAAALLVFVGPQWIASTGQRGESVTVADASTESSDVLPAGVGDVSPAFLRQDIDGDGQIDILDAFALARQIGDEQISVQDGDQNGDGILDDNDVDLIAMTAVTL